MRAPFNRISLDRISSPIILAAQVTLPHPTGFILRGLLKSIMNRSLKLQELKERDLAKRGKDMNLTGRV